MGVGAPTGKGLVLKAVPLGEVPVRCDHRRMDASLLGALIGLVGVGVGAGTAFPGVVYQQRHVDRAALTERKRAEATGAAERLLAELLDVQQLLRRGTYGFTKEESRDHYRTLARHHATIQLHSQWLPDAELRSRLGTNALYTQVGPAGDTRSDVEHRGDGMALCADSIACLGAYLRSEELQERAAAAEQVIARWPEGQDAATFVISGWPADVEEPHTTTTE